MALAMRIEGLGKRYQLGQQREQSGDYVALRDVLAARARDLWKPRDLLKREKPQDFWALKNVNLTVEQGDKVAIIGHNGAGKSTLLKILSQITEPTEGRVELYGRVASLLEVGTGFHPELTGRENIFLNGSVLGMTQAEVRAKFDEIVDFAGVEAFLDTPVKRYSSGMRMRLGFSVAAHLESEILIIDEVLAVGDAAFQKKCLGKMDEVSKAEGRTILFVSHNMGIVQGLCNAGVVLDHGGVAFEGSCREAIDHYHSMERLKGADFRKRARERKNQGHKLVFENVWITNRSGETTTQLDVGHPATIHVQVKANEDVNEGSYVFDIGICNMLNERIALLTSRHFPEQSFLPMKAGESKIINWEIESLPLNIGNYLLQLFLSYKGEVCDSFDYALDFSLSPFDYYRSGYITPPEKNWKFLLSYTMKVGSSV